MLDKNILNMKKVKISKNRHLLNITAGDQVKILYCILIETNLT